MPEYLHPGVYVEEVPSGSRPIEGVSTSTAAFVGVTSKGIPNKARFVSSWAQFRTQFGGLTADSYLPYAVSQFFSNGGKRAYVVRVLNKLTARTATLSLHDRELDRPSVPTLQIDATGGGAWGNALSVQIEDSPTNPLRTFRIVVLYEGEVVETFDELTMDRSPGAAGGYVETEINDVSGYIRVRDLRVADGQVLDTTSTSDPKPLLTPATSYASVATTTAFAGAVPVGAGETAVLEEPNGTRHTVTFPAANPTLQQVIDLLNATWSAANVRAENDGSDHLRIVHNEPGYDRYFLLSGTATGAGKLDFAAMYAAGVGRAQPAVLQSASQSGTFTIPDGTALTLTLTTTAGGAQAITYTFQNATNGGSSDWAVDTIVSELAKHFRDNHGSVLRASRVGDRVRVETANVGRNDATLTAGGAANAIIGFAGPDRTGATTTGLGESEAAFVRSKLGPFSVANAASLYLVVNNRDDAQPLSGSERIHVVLDDSNVSNLQRVSAQELADAINAAISEDSTTAPVPGAHVTASVEAGRVVIRQNQRGPLYTLRVEDGLYEPNIRIGFQGDRQTGYAAGDRDSPYYFPRVNIVAGAVEAQPLVSGSDGSPVSNADYVGDAADKNGLHALDDVGDVSIVTIPGNFDESVLSSAIGYCENRGDCFFIADAPGKRTNETPETVPQKVQDFALNKLAKSTYGALYYPWLEIDDSEVGVGKNPRRFVPPSGFMAGLFARIDTERGVHAAPAGTDARLFGVTDLEYRVTDSEQDILNPYGVNCIRAFPGAGTVAWGARTLGTQSDPEYRYVPVRRYVIYLRQSILRGTQWAVFRPNDHRLWSSLKINIEDFLMGEFRRGALFGTKPDEAFSVKCDEDLNPQSEIDAGRVNVEVRVAVLKPAEFVIIKISQKNQRGS